MAKKFLEMFGNYPKEYNRAVHGPYYPWVNYSANKDTPFAEVKLGDLKAWVMRRNLKPYALPDSVSRLYFRYRRDWLESRRGSPMKFFYHFTIFGSVLMFFSCYSLTKMHRNHKYHW